MTKFSQAFICDAIAAICKLKDLFGWKNFLPQKVQIDVLERGESFETFSKVAQTLICNLITTLLILIDFLKGSTYSQKFSFIVCKDLSLLRPLQRFSRPSSVILPHLFKSQQVCLGKITDPRKFRSMDCKELNLIRLAPRCFKPSSSANIFLSR